MLVSEYRGWPDIAIRVNFSQTITGIEVTLPFFHFTAVLLIRTLPLLFPLLGVTSLTPLTPSLKCVGVEASVTTLEGTIKSLTTHHVSISTIPQTHSHEHDEKNVTYH
jgi:hypothetical protein